MCKEHNIKNPWKGRMVGEVWFALWEETQA
jgi:hypothetical protein